MNKIKFIYFDLGGVIIDWRPAHKTIHDTGGKSVEEINDVFHRNAVPNTSDQNKLLQIFNEELNISISTYEKFAEFYTKAFTRIPETHTLIKDLSDNFSLGLFSNTEPLIIETSIKIGKIPPIHFKAILASCYVGYRKPEIPFYRMAQEKTGVNNDEILFIDDLERNLIPARTLGWHTIQFNTNNPAASCQAIRNFLAGQ